MLISRFLGIITFNLDTRRSFVVLGEEIHNYLITDNTTATTGILQLSQKIRCISFIKSRGSLRSQSQYRAVYYLIHQLRRRNSIIISRWYRISRRYCWQRGQRRRSYSGFRTYRTRGFPNYRSRSFRKRFAKLSKLFCSGNGYSYIAGKFTIISAVIDSYGFGRLFSCRKTRSRRTRTTNRCSIRE